MRMMSPTQIVDGAQHAMSQGDAAGFVSMLSDDVTMTVQGTAAISGRLVGPNAVLAWFGRIAPLVAAATVEPIQRLADGEWVITRDRVVATTVAGRTYRNEYLRLWRCVGGRCVEIVEYLDTEAVTNDLLAG